MSPTVPEGLGPPGPLSPSCPRCAGPATAGEDLPVELVDCATHGPVPPLWRPDTASYDALVAQLARATGLPTYLPWPLRPGWSLTDLGVVGAESDVRATMSGCTGASDLDGAVDLLVVVEEPGTGLGAARAGLPHDGPPPALFEESPQARVRTGGHDVRLWAVPLPEDRSEVVVPDSPGALFDPLADVGLDRSVLVGEVRGRWLWLLVRPASALLLLGGDLQLGDAADLGASLLEVSFAHPPPRW
ncbi:hypothetical protein GCM10009737_28640 [Nocardioides lentus]|uniref:Uncharacterized protein n=1 Tax=Nocardioides lentus TaxID=338077 RepID=A0ABP5B0Y2_9ACTN